MENASLHFWLKLKDSTVIHLRMTQKHRFCRKLVLHILYSCSFFYNI